MIKPQKDFPLIEKYRAVFPITRHTIFAYDGNIYSDYALPPDLLLHEKKHLLQQERDGLEIWVENFLNDPKKRLEYEIEAYQTQVRSVKDRELKNKIRIQCAHDLSSPLYGNIITKDEALQILK